jgi:hypothetical protein
MWQQVRSIAASCKAASVDRGGLIANALQVALQQPPDRHPAVVVEHFWQPLGHVGDSCLYGSRGALHAYIVRARACETADASSAFGLHCRGLVDNSLTGSLPASWGAMSKLGYMWVLVSMATIAINVAAFYTCQPYIARQSENPSCVIVAQTACSNLSRMCMCCRKLRDNSLTGSLPAAWSELSRLRGMWVPVATASALRQIMPTKVCIAAAIPAVHHSALEASLVP